MVADQLFADIVALTGSAVAGVAEFVPTTPQRSHPRRDLPSSPKWSQKPQPIRSFSHSLFYCSLFYCLLLFIAPTFVGKTPNSAIFYS
jgi:hypothetical protein